MNSFNSFASEVALTLCSSSVSAKEILKHVNFLKINSDRVQSSKRCVEVLTFERREKLYTNYLKQKISDIQITSTEGETFNKECRFEFIQKEITNNKTRSVGHNKKDIFLGDKSRSGLKQSRSYIVTQEKKSAQISLDKSSFYLKCRVTSTGYQVDLFTDSSDISLSSSLHIQKNRVVEIGRYTASDTNDDRNLQVIRNRLDSRKNKKTVFLYLKAK